MFKMFKKNKSGENNLVNTKNIVSNDSKPNNEKNPKIINYITLFLSILGISVSILSYNISRKNSPLSIKIQYETYPHPKGTILSSKKSHFSSGSVKGKYMAKIVNNKVILKYIDNEKSVKNDFSRKDLKFLEHSDSNGKYMDGYFVYVSRYDNKPYLVYLYLPSDSKSKKVMHYYGPNGIEIDDEALISPYTINRKINFVNKRMKKKNLKPHNEVTVKNVIKGRHLIKEYFKDNIND